MIPPDPTPAWFRWLPWGILSWVILLAAVSVWTGPPWLSVAAGAGACLFVGGVALGYRVGFGQWSQPTARALGEVSEQILAQHGDTMPPEARDAMRRLQEFGASGGKRW